MLYSKFNSKSFPINFLEYLTAFLIILQCNSLFFPFWTKLLLQICIFLLFIYGFLNIKKYHKDLSVLFVFFVFFYSIMLLFLIFNFYIYHYPLYNIFIFLLNPTMFIVYLYSFVNDNTIDKSIILKLENVVIILAIISLLFWVLANLGMQPNTFTFNDWIGKGNIIPGYFHLFYLTQWKSNLLGYEVFRNTGIFVEAPMHSYVLSIGLLIELFLRKSNLVNYRTIILSITILTTTSTTGIILLIISLLYYYYINTKNTKILIIFISLFLIPITFIALKMILTNKIGTGTDLNSSFNIRVNDIVASFETWTNHFFIGNGIGNSDSIVKNMGYWRLVPGGNIGLSTGFMTTLAYGGIALGSYYIIPTIFVSKLSYRLRGLAIFSFILFIFTIISTANLYLLLLSYFWAIVIYNKEKF